MGGRRWAEVVVRLLVSVWFLARPGPAQVRHPLPVLWLRPVAPPPDRADPPAGVGPAVRLALQDLSGQPPPLGNYEIQFQPVDCQCDVAETLKALFDAMWAGPKYLLVFGGACPSVTALIARSLPALNLVQVSFDPTPPGLDGRHPNFFSTVPSDGALNRAVVTLLRRYGWSRVGVLTQEGSRLSEMKEDLIRRLTQADVQVAAAESLSDSCSSLRRMKDSGVRVIIGQFEGASASEVFCCAYRLNLFGRQYQWVVLGGAAAGWRLQTSGCSADSLLSAADGAFSLQVTHSPTNTRGVSGRTAEEYEAELPSGSKVSGLHAFAYDAVWVAALALSRVTEAVKRREKYSVSRNVSVSDGELRTMLLDAVRQTQFEGVTGPVVFRNGERVTPIELRQVQGGSDVLVGEFSSFTQQLSLQSHLVKFKGSGPAKDRILVRVQRRHISLLLYGVVSSAAAFIIFIALILLLLHITNCRPLRSGAPSRDDLLLLGVLLSSSSVLLSGLDGASVSDPTFDLLCSVRLWFLSVGHTAGFAVLFAETWRVYPFFSTEEKQQAGRLLAALLLLDVFVLSSWQSLDPLRRVVSEHSVESDPVQDVSVRPYSEHCSSSNMQLWLTAVCVYKAPLLGLGCFLAWSIRAGQEVPPAAHRKQLALSMGAVTLSSGLGVSGSLLTSHNPPVQFCLTGLAVVCCNAVVLLWLFGAKFVHTRANGGDVQQTSESPPDAEQQESSSLNLQLRRRTAELDAELESISLQILEPSDSAAGSSSDEGEAVKLQESTHEAQICCELRNSDMKTSRSEEINSPEHVRRRFSLQLPILHLAYLPAVGGLAASSSSLNGGLEAAV